jgi:membrane fusion protein, copper/silver efflux system
MKSILLPLLFSALLMAGCGQNEHHHSQTETVPAEADVVRTYDAPEAFKTGYASALEAYFDLKDALVLTDQAAASEKASALVDAVSAVEHAGLEGEAHDVWMMHREVMITEATRITGEGNVEEQRVHFDPLSESFIETVKSFQPVGFTVYEQMCPMVRGGSANWLSREEQIANPYHGDRMLRCGSVVARI